MTNTSEFTVTHFVCVCTGDMYGMAETYVLRLQRMISRCHSKKFILTCVTDRVRALPDDIQQIDCASWNELRREGMRPTTLKIGLFSPERLPYEDFVYLDLTLVIKSNMEPLLDFMQNSHSPLVIVRDWHYETYNSSVMRIRNRSLRFIYDAFVAGEKFKQKTLGDQDFIHGVIKSRNLDALVSLIPDGYVCSLKQAVRTSRTDSERSRNMINEAIIVKFHGNPKMHDFFDARYRFIKYGIGHLRYLRWGLPFDARSLQKAWECNAPSH